MESRVRNSEVVIYIFNPRRGHSEELIVRVNIFQQRRQRELEIFHCAIRAPRSGRLLLRRDLIFELVNTVVNEVRKRAFSARS